MNRDKQAVIGVSAATTLMVGMGMAIVGVGDYVPSPLVYSVIGLILMALSALMLITVIEGENNNE